MSKPRSSKPTTTKPSKSSKSSKPASRSVWSLTADDGQLSIRTGVAGPAAKMGHRLTIGARSWKATMTWSGKSDKKPTHAELAVDVDSLEVLSGEGGLTPLTPPEKVVARVNTLKSLDAKKFPHIRYTTDDITKTADGYRLNGTLEIRGKSRPQSVEVAVEDRGDSLALSAQVPVCQSDFGIKPFSLMMGSLKVADEVTIDFSATHPNGAA